MVTEWIHSATSLPREGQQIEFLLDSRSAAMKGTYAHCGFHSHWTEYDVGRVRSWRDLTEACGLTSPAGNQAESVVSIAPHLDTTPALQAISGGIAVYSWNVAIPPATITAHTRVDDIEVRALCPAPGRGPPIPRMRFFQ